MTSIIRLSSPDYRIAHDLFVNQNKKIAAIKHVRSTGHLYVDGVLQERVGLKEAKHAVEHEFNHMINPHHVPFLPAAVLSRQPRIKRVVIDCNEGELELDLDGLQLRLLDGLNELPISVIAPALELMQALRDFDNGKQIRRGEDE